MSTFGYHEQVLCCEDVPLHEITRSSGTPVHVYSRRALLEGLQQIITAFAEHQPLVCYSLKANSNLALCQLLAKQGAGADVVSGGELYIALRAGFPPEKIVYAGVGKTEQEIELALRNRILMLNVESEPELEAIERVARRVGTPAPVSIRVNPNVEAGTHEYTTTGTYETKFGVAPMRARIMYEKIQNSKWLQALGVHMHIGSQITDVAPYVEAMENVNAFLETLRQTGLELEYLDLGGGFGISYQPEQPMLALDLLAQRIGPLIPEATRLLLEPGRWLLGPAGVLVCRLIYEKRGPTKRFFIVDAAMNDLVRPTLYDAHHEIVPVRRSTTDERILVDVVGPVCESGDFLARGVSLPPINQGDLLAVMNTGAYGFSMSSTYNGRALLPEVLVDGKNWHIIRERGSYEQLLLNQAPGKAFDASNAGTNAESSVYFWKMEGAGNDFVVVDNRCNVIQDYSRQAVSLCDRRRGVGADGLLLIENSREADFTMRVFNPDGSEAEMCGNGARCAARFAYLREISGNQPTFSTLSGIIEASVGTTLVSLKVANPSQIRAIPSLVIDATSYQGYHVNTGVPHLVVFVGNVDEVPVCTLGRKLRFHQLFQPQGTNVDFVEIAGDEIRVRTYERGVEDETLSCGTGSIASALVSALVYNLTSPVAVLTRGGRVSVGFEHSGKTFTAVSLEGEANIVYRGEHT